MSDFTCPSLNDLCASHVSSIENIVLVIETVLHVLRENALSWSVVTLVQQVGHKQVRDPSFMMVGKGKEGVAYLDTVLYEVISYIPGHV